MLTDLYIANAFTPCDCAVVSLPIEMRTTAGLPETGFPVTVYNVNLDVIGTANDKDEYMSIWNADPFNSAVGYLSGYSAPFFFVFNLRAGPRPVYVYGNPLDNGDGNIIQETGEDITSEDGEVLIEE